MNNALHILLGRFDAFENPKFCPEDLERESFFQNLSARDISSIQHQYSYVRAYK